MANVHLIRKFSFLLLLVVFSSLGYAQVAEQWVRTYNDPANGFDYAYDLAVDALGNVYVTGVIDDGKANDYATVKYDASGNMKWVRIFNGPGDEYDQATSLAVDAKGNVYVTGFSVGNSGTWDYATIKYDAAGNEKWVRWYDGPNSSSDIATSLAVDNQGNVYVTGYSDGNETSSDMATIKYDTNGNELWVRWYNGPGNSSDIAIALALDASGNVYITGSSINNTIGFNNDYATLKYSSSGNKLWVKRYNGPGNSNDIPSAIAVDGAGNVYVTGESRGSDGVADYATVKYDSKGNEKWIRKQVDGSAYSLAADALGNVYVTGVLYGGGTEGDYGTIKYNATGNVLWIRRYNGPGNNSDVAASLALDAQGNVYVSGSSFATATFSDITTVKYDPGGHALWTKSYNGTGNGYDAGISVAVDQNANVYVAGYGFGKGTETDYVTIKYSQASVRDNSCGKDKVLLCHKGKTICVSRNAVDAHLKHGDQLGSCHSSASFSSINGNTDMLLLEEELSKKFIVSVTPNPFNTNTRLNYELPSDGEVSIKLYDVAGREVAVIVQARQKAGSYSTGFGSAGLVKGIYYYRALFTDHQKKVLVQTGKVVVVK